MLNDAIEISKTVILNVDASNRLAWLCHDVKLLAIGFCRKWRYSQTFVDVGVKLSVMPKKSEVWLHFVKMDQSKAKRNVCRRHIDIDFIVLFQ